MPVDLQNAITNATSMMNAWSPNQGTVTPQDCRNLEALIEAAQRVYAKHCPIVHGGA
jgi:hypothetical protein